ncbi:MAG: DEAD/DEAH box helicase family protein [Rikenellaceae bacterium]
MELKRYQQEVIADLKEFIEQLGEDNNLTVAYRKFWEQRGILLDKIDSDYLRPYDNSIKGVPRVTVKVPTAGGKTFIACNALRPIFNSFPAEKPRVVAWFVPSDTILKQTYKNLSNPSHPYRQKIDSHFGSAVRVIDKETALFGQGFNPTEVREQLTILVLSIQSFVESVRNGLPRVYRENENLSDHVKEFQYKDRLIKKADETSLIQVIAQLNPVVVIDESHNFETSLRVDILNDINPSFILDLTATPRNKSNIISFVDAMKLKRENMVKLPVIVYNHNSVSDVIISAITLQRSLELKAIEQEQKGGKYIRPIVLFQAQPKSDDDNITFDKIKNQLVSIGIPEEQIKIKTSERDEIKNINLLSKDCEVRYIITVNALKEGWDCPFAYILASLANKTSKVDVEQILGRVLRLPYTTKHSEELLNLSYVFTSSANFRDTLDNIIESLNRSGFSGKDYRVADAQAVAELGIETPAPIADLFSNVPEPTFIEDSTTSEVSVEEIINTEIIKETISNISPVNNAVTVMEAVAIAENKSYEDRVKQAENEDENMASEVKNIIKTYPMKISFSEVAKGIVLPSFVMKVQQKATIFEQESGTLIPLTKSMLSDGFDLSQEDHKIDFTRTKVEAVLVDLDLNRDDEYVPRYKSLKQKELEAIRNHIISLSPESQRQQLASTIALNIKFDEIPEPHIIKYIEAAIANFDSEQIVDLITYKEQARKRVEDKIKSLLTDHHEKQFNKWLVMGKIQCVPTWNMPNKISPKSTVKGLSKGLYTEEGDILDFEHRMISAIADLDNVLFWHRNLERGHGFFINGFINHYPDFIVVLRSGKIILIETKGDDRDNSNTRQKIDMGKCWADKAGDNYHYFMVFD